MNRLVLAPLALLVLSTSLLFAGDTAKERFEEAFYLEQGERKFKEAAKRYEKLIAEHQKERAIVGKAMLRLGLCQIELGKCDEARATLTRVSKEFPSLRGNAAEALAHVNKPACKCKNRPKSKKKRKKSKKSKKKPDNRSALQIALDKRVTLNFPSTPLAEVVAFCQDVSGGNFALDRSLSEREVNLRVRDVKLSTALNLIANSVGIEFTELHGVGLFTTKEKLAVYKAQVWPELKKLEGEDKKTLALLRKKPITLNFDDTPFEEVFEFFRDLFSLNFVITAKTRDHTRGAEVQLRLRNLPFEQALRLVTSLAGTGYELKQGVIVIDRTLFTEAERAVAAAKERKAAKGSGSR